MLRPLFIGRLGRWCPAVLQTNFVEGGGSCSACGKQSQIHEILMNEQYRPRAPKSAAHDGSITAPYRQLPVTESVRLPPYPRRSIMIILRPLCLLALTTGHSSAPPAITFISKWSRLSIRLNQPKRQVGWGRIASANVRPPGTVRNVVVSPSSHRPSVMRTRGCVLAQSNKGITISFLLPY